MNQKDPIREALLAGCRSKSVVTHAQGIHEANLRFTDEEKAAVRSLRESETFKALREGGGSADRHDYKFLLARLTPTPITVCERTATKINACLQEGLFDEDLNWNKERAAELVESMASSTPDKQGDDKGMYGIGDGGDKSEPKGQADKGTNQKSDHGDHSRTAKSGYMNEDDVKEAKDKAKEAYEAAIAAIEAKGKKEADACPGKDDDNDDDPEETKTEAGKDKDDNDMDYPMKKESEKTEAVAKDQAPKANMAPSPTNDGNTAATDARYKHGAKQNESVEEMKARHEAELAAAQEAEQTENAHSEKSGSTTADPKKSDPGTGSHGSKTEPGKKGGEADTHDPNYEKVKEQDPAHDPKNKGPADAKNESFDDAEAKIVESLEAKGYQRGTPAWDRAYRRGFDMWLTERTGQINPIQE
jgi:hypothetical protein